MSDKQLNSDRIGSSNITTSWYECAQIIQNFDKINVKEIEPKTENINENIFEGDFSIVTDELVNLIFKELNKGSNAELVRRSVLNYIYDQKIILQEFYNWLLYNQYNSNSIYLLGYFNFHGIETDFNGQKAFKLYQKSAELKNNVAQLDLIFMCIHGKGVKKDHNLAYKLSKKLADEGIPYAIHSLGYCYLYGFGINTDRLKAFELFQKAADLGNLNGIVNLGNCYYSGVGTEISMQKAFELYQKAADFGIYYAQYRLAEMYENGDVIKKDMDQAIYWYKKSAEKGYKKAQNKLKEFLNQ